AIRLTDPDLFRGCYISDEIRLRKKCRFGDHPLFGGRIDYRQCRCVDIADLVARIAFGFGISAISRDEKTVRQGEYRSETVVMGFACVGICLGESTGYNRSFRLIRRDINGIKVAGPSASQEYSLCRGIKDQIIKADTSCSSWMGAARRQLDVDDGDNCLRGRRWRNPQYLVRHDS